MDWLHALYVNREWLTLVAAVMVAWTVTASIVFGVWVISGHLDEVDDVCEGCGRPAGHCDSEGVSLCQECFDDLDWMDTEGDR